MLAADVLRELLFQFDGLAAENVLTVLEHRVDARIHRFLHAAVLGFEIDEVHGDEGDSWMVEAGASYRSGGDF
jgi:hypothetical protein